jgi:hypothetical protein
MNDDELRRLLQNSLADRRAPEDVRARLLAGVRPGRPRQLLRAGLAAAAILLVVTVPAALYFFWSAPALPEQVRQAFFQHAFSEVKEHAIRRITDRELAETLREVTGREIQLPGLRDAGFTQLEAHHCEGTRTPHVVYQNSWNKLSCFIYEAEKFSAEAGTPLTQSPVEARLFKEGRTVGVAIREGGIVKLWVSELFHEQVAAIAIDAEQKRYQLQTLPVSITATPEVYGPMGDLLTGISGVEDVQIIPERKECHVRYDQRRVTQDEIMAVLLQYRWTQ